MCSCQQHSKTSSDTTSALPHAGLSFRVEDMACGHCAGTIKKAIETGLPGAAVMADPDTKLVSVQGNVDYATIKSIVIGAGYTPSAEKAA